MLRIALTGGIATGKSYVLEQLRRRGIPCLDADELVHEVMRRDTETTQAIAARFGHEVIGPDGAVDRQKLAPLVFSNPGARRELEAIVHPVVYRAIVDGLRTIEAERHPPLAVVDVPLLFETGREKSFDRVIVTICAPERQLRRLIARGLSETDARQRLAAQWPPEEKASHADFVIRTDGTFEDTGRQLEDVIHQLDRAAT